MAKDLLGKFLDLLFQFIGLFISTILGTENPYPLKEDENNKTKNKK